ncbi:hypothetical protein BDW72DRAFT_183359 [Aspergillus terricola var. indicus]
MNHDTSKTLAADACARKGSARLRGYLLDRASSRLIYLAATCCLIALTSFNRAGVASRRVGQSGVCVRKLRNLLKELEVASTHRRTDNPSGSLPIYSYNLGLATGGVSRHTAEPSYGVRFKTEPIGPFRKSTAAEAQGGVNLILQRVQAVYSQSYFHR